MSNVDLKFFGDVQQALETESDRKEVSFFFHFC